MPEVPQFSARAIVRALKGSWHGGWGSARCPAHTDTTPSFSVSERNGIVLVHCFAGCTQSSVIGALQDRGLWPSQEQRAHPSYPTRTATVRDDDPDTLRRTQLAQAIWESGQPIDGTLAEKYLRSRGVWRPNIQALRFQAALFNPTLSAETPAIIAAISDSAHGICAIQRTYLRSDGTGKSPGTPNKITLGPMREGAVRLFTPRRVLGLAEGIETALAARKIYSIPTWATLGVHRLKSVSIPDGVTRLVIFADEGTTGEEGAREARYQYMNKGYSVEIMRPEWGEDFADQINANQPPEGENRDGAPGRAVCRRNATETQESDRASQAA
ncbi:MAG: toprim domain-containing protein [Patescibacteria group bacterium]|nr:toprim domain-containing protein [Patescibacteria group bacterium]